MAETHKLEEKHNAEPTDVTKMLDKDDDLENALPTLKYKWYHINRDILPAKMAYLLENGRRAPSDVMLSLFYSAIGLSKSEIGLVMGFGNIGSLIAGPFWGWLADRFHNHRTLLVIMAIGSIVTMGSQPLLSMQFGNPETNVCPAPTVDTLSSIFKPNGCPPGSVNCTSNSTIFNTTTTASPTGGYQYKPYGSLFFVMFFTQIAVMFFEASSEPFTDCGVLRRAELSPHRKIDYGRQRFFGAFGVITCVTLSNVFADNFPKANVTCYTALFIMYVILTILNLISVLFLYKGLSFESPKQQQETANNIADEKKESYRKVLRETLTKVDTIVFLLTTFVAGLVNSPLIMFLFLHLKEMNAPSTVFNLSFVCSATGALFGFFFSQNIIKFLGGSMKTILFSVVIFTVRSFGVAAITNSWLVLIFQALHVLSFVLFMASGLKYLKETIPLLVMTTMVSIFRSIFEGLSIMVSLSIAGMIFNQYGGRVMYASFGGLGLLWSIFLAIYIFAIQMRRSKNVQKTQEIC
ncbi:major facilitator superfamily domain-containing protein 6-like isoform X2 [Clytia hemisphaerica]|uniref:Major facilitator superfamily associated domain-containing protein n=1 Tax=Clytia hemisphaerica TaxID=252671 RepID=A0A7M5ULQ2_9CNID